MNLFYDAINLILPQKCSVCGGILGDPTTVFGVESPVCFSCLKSIVPNPSDKRWFLCLSEPYSGDPYPKLTLYMPFMYKGFFSRAIPVIKFGKNQDLALFLGVFLGLLLKSDGVTGDIIVPVPLSEERFKERGFNQAEVISQKVGELLGVPVVNDCLLRIRNTQRQTAIKDKIYRSKNVEGAFKVSDNWSVENLRILLIDDVVTTGNTIHEAAIELKRMGAKQVVCISLAGNRAYKNAESY